MDEHLVGLGLERSEGVCVQDLASAVSGKKFHNRVTLLQVLEAAFYHDYLADSINDHKTTYARAVSMMQSNEAKAFDLSEEQAKAILAMRLGRLTALETDDLRKQLAELRKLIRRLEEILGSIPRQLEVLVEELDEVVKKYADERRTQIFADAGDFEVEDLVAEEQVVVTMSHQSYIKRVPLSQYRRRGSTGRAHQTIEDSANSTAVFAPANASPNSSGPLGHDDADTRSSAYDENSAPNSITSEARNSQMPSLPFARPVSGRSSTV